jgi:hypothetical protein
MPSMPSMPNSRPARTKSAAYVLVDPTVIGWVTHGNLYVTLMLLVGAAEVVLRRWRSLSWHLPLLLLMGVMITAPANNFERHMLPVAFVFGFVCLQFWRESRNARSAASANVASAHEASQVRQDE